MARCSDNEGSFLERKSTERKIAKGGPREEKKDRWGSLEEAVMAIMGRVDGSSQRGSSTSCTGTQKACDMGKEAI